MPSVTLTLARSGYWNNVGVWLDRAQPGAGGAIPAGFASWTGLGGLPAGSVVLSATLTTSVVVSASVVAGPAADPPPSSGHLSMPRVTPTVSGTSLNVTAQVRSALSSGSWSSGSRLGVIFTRSDGSGLFDASLSVEYVTTQYVAPRGASFTLSGGRPVDVTYEINPAAAVLTLSGSRVDVVGPRIVGPAGGAVLALSGGATVTRGVGAGPSPDVAGAALTFAAGTPVSLARTLPPPSPPVPWERIVATPEYLAAITGYEATIDTRVDILDETGTVLERLGGEDGTLPGVLGAEVTCDGEQHIRWSGSLQIDNDDLVPMKVGDLLHPLSYNRARIWWRILLQDDSWAEVPCGTMYMDDAGVTDNGGASVAMNVPLADVSALVKRARMRMSVTVGGMHAHEAIRKILTAAVPFGVPMSLAPLEDRLPAEFEAGQPDADPWAVAYDIATAAGARLYVDRMGTIVLEPLTQRLAHGVGVFAEGDACRVVNGSRSVDLDRVANTVSVTSGARKDADGNELDPIFATWTDDDPTSPTWVGTGHILRAPTVTVDEITTQAQANDYARTLGEDLRSPVEEVTLEAYPHPHLDPDVLVPVDLRRLGVAGDRRVLSWSLVLGPLGLQRINLTGRRDL